jgi:hypothetical protein
MQMKIFGIIGVDFGVTGQLCIRQILGRGGAEGIQ